SAPAAFSRTAAVNERTAATATSASSRARRIWDTVVSMSDSDSRPFPRRDLKVALSRSDKLANTGTSLVDLRMRGCCQDNATGPLLRRRTGHRWHRTHRPTYAVGSP